MGDSGAAARITVDVGGTFTDVVMRAGDGSMWIGKAPTTSERMFGGTSEALAVIGEKRHAGVRELLRECDLLVYSTTRATNAVVESKTARTALITSRGFPDVLVLREGGRPSPFDFSSPFPAPYVPRSLTFEAGGRIDSDGRELMSIDEAEVAAIAADLARLEVEAVGVCLLWSIANPAHELVVEKVLNESLPGVPLTLSHRINPTIREYRRASTTVIDASLKPLMAGHLAEIETDLRDAGFKGAVLGVTAAGGCLHLEHLAAAPVLSINSGPSMAPVAGRAAAKTGGREEGPVDLLVCDAGGTTYDVSLVREAEIPTTREMWLGKRWLGDIVGLPTVAVSSVGAGGGSIAKVDADGLLTVGPASSGAVPGPACYGRGGIEPTVTDAALLLGYLNPEAFLGGRMSLDVEAAEAVVRRHVAAPLELGLERAAGAIVEVASEAMAVAINEATIKQGVDPRDCTMVAGGGAGGLNAVFVARLLGCPRILVPDAAGALSAVGAQHADLVREFVRHLRFRTDQVDQDGLSETLAALSAEAMEFVEGLDLPEATTELSFSVEARYPAQVWELEVPISLDHGHRVDVDTLKASFHRYHRRTFAVDDPSSEVDCQNWKLRLSVKLQAPWAAPRGDGSGTASRTAPAWFGGEPIECLRYRTDQVTMDAPIAGPAILEAEETTVVLPPGATARRGTTGHLLIESGEDKGG